MKSDWIRFGCHHRTGVHRWPGLLEYKDTAPGEGTLLSVRSPSIQEMVGRCLVDRKYPKDDLQASSHVVLEERAERLGTFLVMSHMG